MSQLIKR